MELSKKIEEIMGKHKNDFSGVVLVKNNRDIIYSNAFGYAHMGWKLKPNYSVREAVDFLPQFILKPSKFKPGEKCNYNNVAFILLGLIIEKVSVMNYREYIQKNVFDKIGMSNTEFCSMDGINYNVAEGYAPIRDENGKIVHYRKNIYSYPPIGTPDSGAYTTASDLDLFVRELKNGQCRFYYSRRYV